MHQFHKSTFNVCEKTKAINLTLIILMIILMITILDLWIGRRLVRLTAGRASQDVEAQAGSVVEVQRKDPDVLGGHRRSQELSVGRVPVLGAREELQRPGPVGGRQIGK